MPKQESANWQVALEQFRAAEHTLREWHARNPYPRDSEDEAEQWEIAADAVGGPFCEAMDALEALPAPDLDAVIQKISFIRYYLDGHDLEEELGRRFDLIEKDLRRLA